MNVFTATYIYIDKDHPCVYKLDGGEERMVSVDDYIEEMETDIKLSKGLEIAVRLQAELDAINMAVINQNLTDIILARSW